MLHCSSTLISLLHAHASRLSALFLLPDDVVYHIVLVVFSATSGSLVSMKFSSKGSHSYRTLVSRVSIRGYQVKRSEVNRSLCILRLSVEKKKKKKKGKGRPQLRNPRNNKGEQVERAFGSVSVWRAVVSGHCAEPTLILVARGGTRRRRLLLRELLLGLGLLLVAAVHVASLRPTCAIRICQSRCKSTFLSLYEREGGRREESQGHRPTLRTLGMEFHLPC